MLFPQRFWAGLSDGSVSVAFRRWTRPTVKAGGTLRSPAGILAIDNVRIIDDSDLDERGAAAAGYASVDELRDELTRLGRPDGDLYRVDFHLTHGDPRADLAATATLDDAARADIERRLERMDAAAMRHGREAWTSAVLLLIERRPAVRAGDLATELGRERLPFKADVRKLKELGLTESLDVGYRLSPRGRAYVEGIARR